MELIAEGLLARLVPKQRPPGIGPRCAANEGEIEQSNLRNPPQTLFRQRLIDAECGKTEEVNDDHRPDRRGGILAIICMLAVLAAFLFAHSFAVRKRSELRTTEMEDALMAKAANIGLIRMPKNG